MKNGFKILGIVLLGIIFTIGLLGFSILSIACGGIVTLLLCLIVIRIAKGVVSLVKKIRSFQWKDWWQANQGKLLHTCFWGLILLLISAIMVLLAAYVSSHKDMEWHGVHTELMTLTMGILVTLLSMYLISDIFVPKIEISNVLAISPNTRLRVLVKNKFLFTNIYNIHIEMYYYRYDAQLDDEILEGINMDSDDAVTILYGKYSGNGHEKNTYTFHTKDGFVDNYKNYSGVKCRVTVTHSVFGTIKVYDKYYKFHDTNAFQRGNFINDRFEPQSKLYTTDIKRKQYETINSYSMAFPKILIAYQKEVPNDIRKTILNAFQETTYLLTKHKQLFPELVTHKQVIYEIKKDLKYLLTFYNDKSLSPSRRDEREKRLQMLRRNLVFITKQMENCIINS